MRQGRYASAEAEDTIKKFDAAIAACEGQARGETAPGAPATLPRGKAADDTVEKELLTRIDGATTPETWEELQRHVLGLRVRSLVSDSFIRVFNDTHARWTKNYEIALERARELQAGEPLKIVIVYEGLKR